MLEDYKKPSEERDIYAGPYFNTREYHIDRLQDITERLDAVYKKKKEMATQDYKSIWE